MLIPFNRPYLTGREMEYITEAHALGHLSGDGAFSRRCARWLEQLSGSPRAILAHSCTAALEMAAILADLRPGDEVIMPSFTFVSTANALVLRGAVPVFVDIRADTLNLDERLIEAAITPRTRAIVPVHYAGIACEMDAIMEIAARHNLIVIEDAAQALMACFRDRPLGSIGHLAAYSFHETKNIIAGEAGALLVNDADLAERAEIIAAKGTDRNAFLRGEIDKYSWVDIGSSFQPSDIVAAFLWAQIESVDTITLRRMALWNAYHDAFASAEQAGWFRRPVVPAHCRHNAHLYYLLLPSPARRGQFIDRMRAHNIHCVFHYVPLHSSSAGRRFSRSHGDLDITTDLAARLVRIPLWLGLEEHQDRVIDRVLMEAAA